MRVPAGRQAVRIVGAAVAAIVVLGVLAQLLLPGIAADRVRSELAKYGPVKSVHVKAWPAVKLLFKHADEVTASTGALRLSQEQAVSLLEEAKGTQTVEMRAQALEMAPLRLTDARLEKHSSQLRIGGVLSLRDINRALPSGLEVTLVGSGAGQVTVRASGGVFGTNAGVEAVVQAEGGKLVVHPSSPLLSGLKLTVFEAPGLVVEGVEAHAIDGGGGPGQSYALSLRASLR